MLAMGIERARVVEVHSATSPAGVVGSGYLVGERLVLTAGAVVGRHGPTDVRSAGTATWHSASTAWTAGPGAAALLDLDGPLAPAGGVLWGEITGRRPVPVAAMGFPPATSRPQHWRDPEPFFGQLTPGGGGGLGVDAAPGNGLRGAALFAGAELVAVLLAGLTTVPVATLAADPHFAALAAPHAGGRLALRPVRAAPGFSIL